MRLLSLSVSIFQFMLATNLSDFLQYLPQLFCQTAGNLPLLRLVVLALPHIRQICLLYIKVLRSRAMDFKTLTHLHIIEYDLSQHSHNSFRSVG